MTTLLEILAGAAVGATITGAAMGLIALCRHRIRVRRRRRGW